MILNIISVLTGICFFFPVHFIYVIFGYFSLENISDKIRWSLDLRWQRPDKPNGFYGLKVYWQCQDGDLVAHVVKKKYRAIDEAIKLRRFIQMTSLS